MAKTGQNSENDRTDQSGGNGQDGHDDDATAAILSSPGASAQQQKREAVLHRLEERRNARRQQQLLLQQQQQQDGSDIEAGVGISVAATSAEVRRVFGERLAAAHAQLASLAAPHSRAGGEGSRAAAGEVVSDSRIPRPEPGAFPVQLGCGVQQGGERGGGVEAGRAPTPSPLSPAAQSTDGRKGAAAVSAGAAATAGQVTWDALQQSVGELERMVASSAAAVSRRDAEEMQQQLLELQKQMDSTRALQRAQLPQRKFKFSSNSDGRSSKPLPTPSAASQADAAGGTSCSNNCSRVSGVEQEIEAGAKEGGMPTAASSTFQTAATLGCEATRLIISDRSGETIAISTAVDGGQARSVTMASHSTASPTVTHKGAAAPPTVVLSKLRHCSVSLTGVVGALTVREVEDCQLCVGPVSGAAHISNVRRSTVEVAAQQLRVHSCADVTLKVRSTSRPILEGCMGLRMGPYTFTYENVGSDLRVAGLNCDTGMWRDPADVGWLRPTPSPNWSLLPGS